MRADKMPTWIKYLVAFGFILKQHDFHSVGLPLFTGVVTHGSILIVSIFIL